VLFIGGVYVAAYGLSATRYSRWDHTYNARVHPVFHPWAIAVGVVMIWIAIRKTRSSE